MSEYLRVKPPTIEECGTATSNISIQIVSESLSVSAGDIRILTSSTNDSAVLWVAVTKIDENNGVAEVVLLQPDSLLSDADSLIIENVDSPNYLELSVWPKFVGTVWKEDLISKPNQRNLVGSISPSHLLEIVKASLPGDFEAGVLPPGMRRGIPGINNSPGFERYISMQLSALSTMGESVWESFINVYLGQDVIEAVIYGNAAVLQGLQKRSEFKVSKEDLRKCKNELAVSRDSRVLIRNRRVNEILKAERLINSLPTGQSMTILTENKELVDSSPVLEGQNRRRYELVTV